jgi:hypothetical protein
MGSSLFIGENPMNCSRGGLQSISSENLNQIAKIGARLEGGKNPFGDKLGTGSVTG